MDAVYELLAERASAAHKDKLEREQNKQQPNKRVLIALAGAPGSGKSTIAAEVARRLNSRAGRSIAAVLPMDGFHYPRAYLDNLPNRDEAYARRGAHWTFDASGVVALARQLSSPRPNGSEVIFAPGFDHAIKDPVEKAIQITRDIEVVILEGNWLLYDGELWNEIPEIADETWFVEVSPLLARDRIAKRHLEAGIEDTWDAAVRRAEKNDLPNGEEIRQHLVQPDIVVESIEEQATEEAE